MSTDSAAGNVKAILGPTNTGKTHYAVERLLAHRTGMIGLPLRLLAREVYQRLVERVGSGAVALVTGEERIAPKNARYWVATVEAMPTNFSVECVAIDEIQTATHLDRGHVFTDRILNARGTHETLLLGAATMPQSLPHCCQTPKSSTAHAFPSSPILGPKRLPVSQDVPQLSHFQPMRFMPLRS